MSISVAELIMTRRSVRTFSEQPVSEEIRQKITDYLAKLTNPFQVKVAFKLMQSDAAVNAAKLGTYGVIKGAKDFFGAAVKDGDFALEALGYEFEQLILYIESLGLGTCWLGGTFNRSEFAQEMALESDERLVAISPFGFEADKRSFTEKMMRRLSKGDSRNDWSALFFDQNFAVPLTPEAAGDFASALEMVRLAPSASNKQPWRIIKDKQTFHFFEQKAPGYSQTFAYDIQRVDMGIAACHFELTNLDQGRKGHFEKLLSPDLTMPENIVYAFTWIAEGFGS